MTANWQVGQDVICNGFPGTIIKIHVGQLEGMADIRLESGVVCVELVAPDVYAAPIEVTNTAWNCGKHSDHSTYHTALNCIRLQAHSSAAEEAL